MPKSLGGQMALLLGLALLVAQVANFALILNERQKLTSAQNQGPAITRFAELAADVAQAAPEFRAAVITDASHRGARFALKATNDIADADRDATLEGQARRALAGVGVTPEALRATSERVPAGKEEAAMDRQYLRIAISDKTGAWLNGRLAIPKRDPWLGARLGAATLLLYLIVLGATVWIAMRLARPLRQLTNAAEAFGGREAPMPVKPSGPSDLRHAIEAFNAMNLRVIALLDEKDRMLGAIGHDLRTPLASLRIRIESMDPEDERDAAVAKIAEMTAMLEDILVLARTGRAREDVRLIDVSALAETVVEEFRTLGQDVVFTEGGRCVGQIQLNLIRRALTNLIDNAVFYAGSAAVSVMQMPDGIEISVVDHGPGILPEEMAMVLQPFYRTEGSRNRETGGSGLGLAIASSIAESHGGHLQLRASVPQGLTALLKLPATASTKNSVARSV
ncbi:HAMP domain-containing sensor histidine kinase [soil metagenome]